MYLASGIESLKPPLPGKHRFYIDLLLPKIKEMTHTTKKITKRILANCVAVPAIPVNPSKPATMAMIRKTRVQCSMGNLPGLKERRALFTGLFSS
jgi:hypothetical protein